MQKVTVPLEPEDFEEVPETTQKSCEGKMFCSTGPNYPVGLKMRSALEALCLKNIREFQWRFETDQGPWASHEEWFEIAHDENPPPHLRKTKEKGGSFDPVMLLAKRSWWKLQHTILEREGKKGISKNKAWLVKEFGIPTKLVIQCNLRLLPV